MEDLVSIIMPTYNCGKFIGETIESIISQTYKNWELLITDDCSSDNTEEVVLAEDYHDTNVSVKVVKLIQSYAKIVDKTVWLKN